MSGGRGGGNGYVVREWSPRALETHTPNLRFFVLPYNSVMIGQIQWIWVGFVGVTLVSLDIHVCAMYVPIETFSISFEHTPNMQHYGTMTTCTEESWGSGESTSEILV